MTINLRSFAIEPGECVAVVGAGGKTSLCWLLAQVMVRRGSRVIFTTTTRIRQPAPGTFDVQWMGTPDVPAGSLPWRTACLASAIDGEVDETPVSESLMPVVHTKLAGFRGDAICSLHRLIPRAHPPITIIVEADGARGLLLKAPFGDEPVIPACSTTVCVVANLESLGQPLDGRVAHRVERITQLTGAQIGQPITPQLLVDLLAHPDGGLKGIPPAARRVAVLMQRDEVVLRRDANCLVQALVAGGFDQALVIAPRAGDVHPLISAKKET